MRNAKKFSSKTMENSWAHQMEIETSAECRDWPEYHCAVVYWQKRNNKSESTSCCISVKAKWSRTNNARVNVLPLKGKLQCKIGVQKAVDELYKICVHFTRLSLSLCLTLLDKVYSYSAIIKRNTRFPLNL